MQKNVLLFSGLLLITSSARASQSSFHISPQPVAAPEFSSGKIDKKIAATYISITANGLHLDGLGGSYIVRQANSDITAPSLSASIFLLGGTMDTGTSNDRGELYAVNVPLSMTLEYQPVQNELASMILFAGPTLNPGISSFKYSYKNTVVTSYVPLTTSTAEDTMSTSTTSLLYGVQGGLQAAIHTRNFIFAPFTMLQTQRGAASASFSSSRNSGTNAIDIPAFTSISYGLDILYRPWNMTLSSMHQEAEKSGSSNDGFKSIVISLNWIY